MNDLARWLSAQLDADERREHGKYTIHGSTIVQCPQYPNMAYTITEHAGEGSFDPCGHTMPRREFLETFGTPDPDWSVLADIDAKRRILWRYQRATETTVQHARRVALEEVVEDLAAAYADRDGYDERWRP